MIVPRIAVENCNIELPTPGLSSRTFIRIFRKIVNTKTFYTTADDFRATLPVTPCALLVALKCASEKHGYYSNSYVKDILFDLVTCRAIILPYVRDYYGSITLHSRLCDSFAMNPNQGHAIFHRQSFLDPARKLSSNEQITIAEKSRELGHCALRGSYRKSVVMTLVPNYEFHVNARLPTSYLIVINSCVNV